MELKMPQLRLLLLLMATLPGMAAGSTIIVDNADSGFQTASGAWTASANTGFYGTNSLIAPSGGAEYRARWTAQLPTAGEYDLSAWWVPSFNRGDNVGYTVGQTTVRVNQTTGASQWNPLGRFTHPAGASSVEISTSAAGGSYVSADAVRWQLFREVEPCDLPTVSTITSLGGSGNCAGNLLPGSAEPHPTAKWIIHSDLPERFSSNGVLYTSRPVLPPDSANSVPLSLRTQTSNGFETIDGNFDLFLFHITTPGDGSAPRRIVIHAKNTGTEAVVIQPRQVIISSGLIGNVHEMESTLGRRWMEANLDTRYDTVTLLPGEGGPIGYSNNFGGFGAGVDANINCFGMLRAEVLDSGEDTSLEVSVVAIPSGNVSDIAAATNSWLDVAATSAESSIDITTPPPPGALRRAVGVFPGFEWTSSEVVLDAATLTAGGTSFQMALSQIQAGSCPTGRQTIPMALHPGFAHGDTIGNYMVDYRTTFRIINSDPSNPRAFDLQFGRSGADIGLGWQVALGGRDAVDAASVNTSWAGPSQSDGQLYDSMLGTLGGPVTIGPCSEVEVGLRFNVLGNSSLPFQLRLVSATPDPNFGSRQAWMVF